MISTELPAENADYYKPLIRKKVNRHISTVIIEGDGSDEFMFGRYDETYPLLEWRNKLCLIGGNHDSEDISPQDILKREINEEFEAPSNNCEVCGNQLSIGTRPIYAKIEEIISLRDSILESMRPFNDFSISVPSAYQINSDGLITERAPFTVISSVFYSKIPRKVFQQARNSILSGARIRQEGYTDIISLSQLKKYSFIPGAGKILEKYILEHKGINVGPLEKATSEVMEVIGKPRNVLEHYCIEYDYLNPVRICTG